MCFVDSTSYIRKETIGMSPCEEGMSPNPAKWKKFPLNKESSKWFVGKPLSSRLTGIVCLFGTICGRESQNYRAKIIYLWLVFSITTEEKHLMQSIKTNKARRLCILHL